MDGFVLDDLFQHSRRRIPADGAHLEEAGVEPGLEGIFKFCIERLEALVASGRAQQIGAHRQQATGAVRREVEHGNQP